MCNESKNIAENPDNGVFLNTISVSPCLNYTPKAKYSGDFCKATSGANIKEMKNKVSWKQQPYIYLGTHSEGLFCKQCVSFNFSDCLNKTASHHRRYLQIHKLKRRLNLRQSLLKRKKFLLTRSRLKGHLYAISDVYYRSPTEI